MEKAPYEFIAIGDITTDAFIRIHEASVTCDVNREKCKLCLSFGDKVPYDSVDIIPAVGNSPNAAVSATRLGLHTALITNLGDDHNGGECLATLKKNNVSTELVTTHKNKATNYHYVLWYEEERTILIKHQEYNYSLIPFAAPQWLYLSSLAQNSLKYHEEIITFLKNNPETKLAFQPGTFQMKMGLEKIGELYKHSELFFCNVEEAKRILGIMEDIDTSELLEQMHKMGPKLVVITDGPKGAYAYDGTEAWFMPPYPDPKPPLERTGAGDAFASTVTSALALGKTLPEALQWGPINSMSVVQQVGAQRGLLTREKLEEFLQKAPENYRPQKFS